MGRKEDGDGYYYSLENLTRSKNWDGRLFQEILLELSRLESDVYIPYRNIPESVNITRFWSQLGLMNLFSGINKKETHNSIYAYPKIGKIFAGYIYTRFGDETSVDASYNRHLDRHLNRRCIGDIHTQPGTEMPSGADIKHLLYSTEHAVMIISDSVNFNKSLTLKTSLSPKFLTSTDDYKIDDIYNKAKLSVYTFLSDRGYKNPSEYPDLYNLVNTTFCKTICSEYNFVFYKNKRPGKLILDRVY